MAIFAVYAQTQDKFWEMNDTLFEIGGNKDYINAKELAEKVGLDYRALLLSIKNRIIRYKVKHDISIGIKLGINGTPCYVINDQVYLGQIPPKILKDVMD
jgi:protein-disulfide isomerase